MNPKLRGLIRRISRLLRISTDTQNTSSGGAISIYHPLKFEPTLQVVLKRISYPDYQIETTSPLFESRAKFLLWEAANEMKMLLYKASAIDSMHSEVVNVATGVVSASGRKVPYYVHTAIEKFTERLGLAVQQFEENLGSDIDSSSLTNDNGHSKL